MATITSQLSGIHTIIIFVDDYIHLKFSNEANIHSYIEDVKTFEGLHNCTILMKQNHVIEIVEPNKYIKAEYDTEEKWRAVLNEIKKHIK